MPFGNMVFNFGKLTIGQTEDTLSIITNQAVIAVSQDANGSPASRIWKRAVTGGDVQLWVAYLVNK